MHKNSKYHIIYQTLDKLGIKYQCLQHNPIMTMEEGAEISKILDCTSCKSLFLTNKKQEYYLLLLPANKKLSTQKLAQQIGSTHLSFASKDVKPFCVVCFSFTICSIDLLKSCILFPPAK